jgi:hypothetical protein
MFCHTGSQATTTDNSYVRFEVFTAMTMKMLSSVTLHNVAQISELGMLAVTSNRSMLRRNNA